MVTTDSISLISFISVSSNNSKAILSLKYVMSNWKRQDKNLSLNYYSACHIQRPQGAEQALGNISIIV